MYPIAESKMTSVRTALASVRPPLSTHRIVAYVVMVISLMFAHLSAYPRNVLPLLVAERDADVGLQQGQLLDHQPQQLQQSEPGGKPAVNELRMSAMSAQAVIDAVPEEERGSFIIEQLALALEWRHDENAHSYSRSAMPQAHALDGDGMQAHTPATYDTFEVQLLHWVRAYFGASDSQISQMVRNRNVLCTANGTCYNKNQIGCLCCPF